MQDTLCNLPVATTHSTPRTSHMVRAFFLVVRKENQIYLDKVLESCNFALVFFPNPSSVYGLAGILRVFLAPEVAVMTIYVKMQS